MEPVSNEQGRKVADRVGACCYIECSAPKGINKDEVFDEAVRYGLKYRKNKQQKPEKTEDGCCEVF